MFEPLLEVMRRECSGDRALASVHAITRHHRIQASPGYDQAADWLGAQVEAAGLELEREEVDGDGRTRCLGALMPEGWDCSRAVATLHDGAGRELLCDFDALALSVVQRSAPGAGRFPIVALEDGTEDGHYRGLDVRGRVVLTAGNPHRVHRLAVVERGAAGLLCDGRRLMPPVREADHDLDSVAYTSFWWNGDEPRGWGFVVSPRRGRALRERLRQGDAPELEVAIESRRFATRIPLLSGVLRGRRPGEIVLISHLCHPRPSANDNASGVAASLEAARALAAHLGRSGGEHHTLRFLWVPELTGTYAWLSRDPGRAARAQAALNLDMVGEDQAQCGSTFLIEHPPCFMGSFAETLLARIRERALDWVTSYSGPGVVSLTRTAEVPYSGGSDHAVWIDPSIGVPCPMMIQWPDRFYHSSYDTPDRCDPASLALAARCAATWAAFLATAGAPETEWLAGLTGRGARRRALATLDAPDAPRRLEAERMRGERALASLARLGPDGAGAAGRERERLETLAAGEHLASPQPRPAGERAVPARPPGPLDSQRHLLPGWAELAREERERMRAFDARVPGGATTLEVAWYACDGRRAVDEIARLVWLETGHHAPQELREFFEWTARLGISTWTPEPARR